MQRPSRPIVIAHRGASGYRPEHTLAAYAFAIEQGVDFIEPDLVATRDGVLICRHENALAVLNADDSLNTSDTSTNVYQHPVYRARLATKHIDGREIRGWFSEDFTLAEIKTLRAIERIPALRPQNTSYDGQFEIPTFAEVLALIKQLYSRTGKKIGVYPETKHPSYFSITGTHIDGTSIQMNLGYLLLEVLLQASFTDPTRVFIQSFEISNLKELKQALMPTASVSFPLIQLIDASGAPYDTVLNNQPLPYAEMLSSKGLGVIAEYASGIGPYKLLLIPRDANNELTHANSVINDAHASGLLVHPWTFRAENFFLPDSLKRGAAHHLGLLDAELACYLDADIDGLFSDHPDYAVRALSSR